MNQSRSPSYPKPGKSKDKKKKYYNFNQKSVMLTYTHTDNPKITKQEIGEYFRDISETNRKTAIIYKNEFKYLLYLKWNFL